MRARSIIRSDIEDNADTRQLFGVSGDRTLRYLASIVLTGFATAIAVGIDAHVVIPNVSLVFVVPVIIAAAVLGAGPSFLSAVLGALAYNYFLTEPRFTLSVDDPANILAIGLLLCTSAIVSGLAGYSDRARAEGAESRQRADLLAGLAKDIAGAHTIEACCVIATDALTRLQGTAAVILIDDQRKTRTAAQTPGAALAPADLQAAQTSIDESAVSLGGIYPSIASRWDFWPLQAGDRAFGVIGALHRDDAPQLDGMMQVFAALLASRLKLIRTRTTRPEPSSEGNF